MREEYDFSNARKNPYTKKLKKQITINIDSDTIQFFKDSPALPGFLTRRSSIYTSQTVLKISDSSI